MVLESGDSGTYEILVKDCMGEVTDSFRHRGRMELLSVQVWTRNIFEKASSVTETPVGCEQ